MTFALKFHKIFPGSELNFNKATSKIMPNYFFSQFAHTLNNSNKSKLTLYKYTTYTGCFAKHFLPSHSINVFRSELRASENVLTWQVKAMISS